MYYTLTHSAIIIQPHKKQTRNGKECCYTMLFDFYAKQGLTTVCKLLQADERFQFS